MKLCCAVLIAMLIGLSGCKPPGGAKAIPVDSLDAPEESKTLLKGHAAKAARFGRNAFVHFSLVGCGPCMRLDEDVLFKREWRDFAKENLIETVVEFPNEITSEDTVLVQNMQAMEALAKRLDLTPGFPQVVILGRDGSVLGGRAGYQPGGVSGYISWAKSLLETDTSPRTPSEAPQSTQTTNPPSASPVVHKSALPEPAQTGVSSTGQTAVAPLPAGAVSNAVAQPVDRPSNMVAATNKIAKAPFDYLKIMGLLGKRIAMLSAGAETINVKAGDERAFPTPAGELRLRCVEIRAQSVLILVDGETVPRELFF